MGMGRCHLALQHCVLYPTRYHEVRHSVHLERKGMAQLVGEQGIRFFPVSLFVNLSRE